MKNAERIERAWVLAEMRRRHRLPSWFTDAVICSAVEVPRVVPPPAIQKRNREWLNRPLGRCPDCRRMAQLGCWACWDPAAAPSIDSARRIALLRSARDQGVVPSWLSDSALARAFAFHRGFVSTQVSTEISCRHCIFPATSQCLACFLEKK